MGVRDLRFTVDGMDCGSCAIKSEAALSRLPGVSQIRVNATTGSLNLQIETTATDSTAIERSDNALGYGVRPASADVQSLGGRSSQASMPQVVGDGRGHDHLTGISYHSDSGYYRAVDCRDRGHRTDRALDAQCPAATGIATWR